MTVARVGGGGESVAGELVEAEAGPATAEPVAAGQVGAESMAAGQAEAEPVAADLVAAEPIDEVLSALADPTRRRLLDLVAVRGAASATELAGELPVSRQAVVKHLAVLDAAGLVTGRRVGREVRFEVRSAPLDATARWMASLAADWDRRLARIKAVAEAAEAAAQESQK